MTSPNPTTTTSHASDGNAGPEVVLHAFSSVTIHGLAFRGGEQVPVTLRRTVSYPAGRFTRAAKTSDEIDGWDAIPPPVGKRHLELKLGKRLGVGRIGFVYEAEVIDILDEPDGAPVANPPLDVSTQLVIKVVRPTNCRSLARESWFYERLSETDGFQGAVVPLCYGFFTALTTAMQAPSLAPLEIKPWIDKHGKHVPLEFSKSKKEYGDYLPDDSDYYHDDQRTCRTDSPWYKWQPDPENPLLGVLLLERLGEAYSGKIYNRDLESRNDILNLIDDLSAAAVMHHDFRYNNIARSRSNVVCPRHGYPHGWRVIDFDRSEKWGKTIEGDNKFFTKFNRRQYVDHDFPAHFWYALNG